MKKPTNVPIVTNNIGTIAAFIPIPTKKPIESEANIIEININATENNEIIKYNTSVFITLSPVNPWQRLPFKWDLSWFAL